MLPAGVGQGACQCQVLTGRGGGDRIAPPRALPARPQGASAGTWWASPHAYSADEGQISETQPCIDTGMRGAIALEVEVTTAAIDLHSGIKGGSVQNANQALVQLLVGLRGPPGPGDPYLASMMMSD